MIIQERQWSECICCGRRDKLLQEELYGCDQCKKEIDLINPDVDKTLRLKVVYHGSRSGEFLHFCSWFCVLKFLKRFKKTEYYEDGSFISLPFVNYDHSAIGVRYQDFFAAMKQLYAPKRKAKQNA